MGLTATIYLTNPEAHKLLESGDVNSFYDSFSPDLKQDVPDVIDLSIYWHAIHYLITNENMGHFLTSGVQLPDVDELCESHSATAICDLNKTLSGKTASDLMPSYSLEELNKFKIYPVNWDEKDRSFLHDYLTRFLEFVKFASSEDYGFFVVIS